MTYTTKTFVITSWYMGSDSRYCRYTLAIGSTYLAASITPYTSGLSTEYTCCVRLNGRRYSDARPTIAEGMMYCDHVLRGIIRDNYLPS